MTIIAAADGSALGNPGPAGWAWYIDADRWRCGGWTRGTNNQGELTAVLDLLRQTADCDEPLHVLCDSQYVINSVTKWTKGWKRKGWKKADGKPVLNVELMKALDEAMAGRSVTFEWVKGHAGHELNEKADALANGAATAHSSGEEPQPGPGFPGARSVGAGDDPAAPPAPDGAAGDGATGRPAPSRASVGSDAPEPDLFTMDDDDAAPASARADTAVDLLVDLERSLLTDAVRGDRTQLATLLAPGWRSVGARGELRSRDDQLAAAEDTPGSGASRSAGDSRNSGEAPTMELIEARELGADVVLLVWREVNGSGSVLRSSVWHHDSDTWRQVFQQDTPEA